MNATEVLRAIEVDAERSIPQELVNMIHDVQLLRSALDGEDRDYADCLLLKLDHLLCKQQLAPLDGKAQDSGVVAGIVTPCPATSISAMRAVEEEVLSAA